MLFGKDYSIMNIQEIGFFLFMEEEEKRQHEEVNAELEMLFVGEKATQTKEEQ